MPRYILSNANRFYSALETGYGQVPSITAANRFVGTRMQAHQVIERARRTDKTGNRSYIGLGTGGRRRTAFEVRTFLTSLGGAVHPSYGTLLQAALGSITESGGSIEVAAVTNATNVQSASPHGLTFGSGIALGGELRFVSNVIDSSTFTLNAPFSGTLQTGAILSGALTYRLSTVLPTLSLFDYWDPITTVSRIITGASVNTFNISVNGDYHEFLFSGPAADLLDSRTLQNGTAGLPNFPSEPALEPLESLAVPGHLGQVWLGNVPNQFFTMTGAAIRVKNNVAVRNDEFGSSYPRTATAGQREVETSFAVMAQDDEQTQALYAVGKQGSTLPVMFQLGQQQGQLLGVYLPRLNLELPTFNDSATTLEWMFKSNVAEGANNDELILAVA